ncbi:arsenate reductase (azurin) small subunit [Rhodanobacter sp. B2A1Ga4]|uniref:arsenate reductase (azurin) small subunit n=1 Tax=Rhodanobacter sp. B2A1Ga4 TaxID=2778647 RepID=UPI001B3653B8|nr:arsenate reductase (azurin) small subunit [Rhodanobacter sp. B2A1Ga4]MBQ4855866.1 arsenate reductase (azurin) small subunit [Rhodanobacter sp. B2A1Ga4]
MSESEQLSRRKFLKIAGVSVAGAGAAITSGVGLAAAASGAKSIPGANAGSAMLAYPKAEVGKAGVMKVNEPVYFTYPDLSSPCIALKMGRRVAGGVGPQGDIVAFSQLCTHMGCPVSYEAETARLKCPCHYSMFDPEKSGQMIAGQATVDLPQIQLEYMEASDTIQATAINGLIYGRQANLL